MMIFGVISLMISGMVAETVYYDAFYGTAITADGLKKHIKDNTTFWCVTDVETCDPREWRRIDGSCNNLQRPTRGARHTPFARILPTVYSDGFEPRLTKSGGQLPLARYIRTSLLQEGKSPHPIFTQLVANYLVITVSDVVTVQDTVNYVIWKPYCCAPKGKTDPMCTPNEVPEDDPVHRYAGLRCLNMTRPISYQSCRCLKNDTVPERINSATPILDLSLVYGSTLKSNNEKARLFERGMLKYEIDDYGRIWPPSTKTKRDVCYQNVKPSETRCHDSPDNGLNSLFGVNVMSMIFWREHNRIAKKLSKLNPCWDDEKLFQHARDITIATYLQILLYELYPLVLGTENLLKENIISSSSSFRDIYDPKEEPKISLEYLTALRWVHTIQEGTLKMYNQSGFEVGEFPIVNLTLRTGYLAKGRNLDYLTQGMFRQAGANEDYTIHPDIVGTALGSLQQSSDLATNDLAKNRYFGFAPYVKYLEHCQGRPYNSFEDLLDVIEPERLEIIKDLYQHVEDIDLMAGIWVEKHIEGGHFPKTVACIVLDQLRRTIVSDRHWYERAERPHAFTEAQLQQIRKVSISKLVCDNGDSVIEIQPRAFERIAEGNELRKCDEIESIDLTAWKDHTCGKDITAESR